MGFTLSPADFLGFQLWSQTMWSPRNRAGLQFRNSALNFFLLRKWSAQDVWYDSAILGRKSRNIITEESLDEPSTRSNPEAGITAHTTSFSCTTEMKSERVFNFVWPATCRLREKRRYNRDWARVHATYSKRLVLMISLGWMAEDFMKLTFLPQCLHSCRMETFLGPLDSIY